MKCNICGKKFKGSFMDWGYPLCSTCKQLDHFTDKFTNKSDPFDDTIIHHHTYSEPVIISESSTNKKGILFCDNCGKKITKKTLKGKCKYCGSLLCNKCYKKNKGLVCDNCNIKCDFCEQISQQSCYFCKANICKKHASIRKVSGAIEVYERIQCPQCASKKLIVDGSACFIATAAYGTPFNSEIGVLRKWRDIYLNSNIFGRILVSVYYFVSPPIAGFISTKPRLRKIVRVLLKPLIKYLNQIFDDNFYS